MNFDEKALIHDRKCFDRRTLEERLKQLKFNSLARMELFLWDLEIFLQIQSVLKEKIVLKGGAAAQFYLPIDYQRTAATQEIKIEFHLTDEALSMQRISSLFKLSESE